MDEKLTPAAARILAEVRKNGPKVYNARARRPIESLEKLGLVTVDWDTNDQAKGSGLALTWRITVTAKRQKMASKPQDLIWADSKPETSDCRACRTGKGRHTCGLAGLQDMFRF